mmetsp:Transcript_13950/g.39710  ORF Transcript_13950/g.39710 Transcript_13950/m.39710 type:complete len:263 (+) Transcript_13950:811-1599(+)
MAGATQRRKGPGRPRIWGRARSQLYLRSSRRWTPGAFWQEEQAARPRGRAHRVRARPWPRLPPPSSPPSTPDALRSLMNFAAPARRRRCPRRLGRCARPPGGRLRGAARRRPCPRSWRRRRARLPGGRPRGAARRPPGPRSWRRCARLPGGRLWGGARSQPCRQRWRPCALFPAARGRRRWRRRRHPRGRGTRIRRPARAGHPLRALRRGSPPPRRGGARGGGARRPASPGRAGLAGPQVLREGVGGGAAICTHPGAEQTPA